MQDLVTELQVARIVQWMLRPAAVALWLGTLIVPLRTQPAPPPPAPAQIKPAQIKDVQIPKLTIPPRLEQFLGGASRADLRRIDDFRQRQPGDGVPVSRKTAGVAPFLANGGELQTTLTLRPVARLKIDQIYYLTRMWTAQASVFVNHLTRTRANYQFTRALSLRMIVDYNAVLENASLIDLTRQKRITGDALVTYLIHPGTAFYVGYTDRLENLALTNGTVLPIGFPSTTTARQFFAKVSYMFRF